MVDLPTKYQNGYLKIVVGCMFSGKTSYIIKESLAWKSIGKRVLMINYVLDTRYSTSRVVSHDRNGVECIMVPSIDQEQLKNIGVEIDGYDVIIVDEAQFFENLRGNIRLWCDKMKKIVVVSGLDGDYKRNNFGNIYELISDCDEYVKLKAYCAQCKNGTYGIFTQKKNIGTTNDSIVDIGGHDKYEPLCRAHYNLANDEI